MSFVPNIIGRNGNNICDTMHAVINVFDILKCFW